MRESGRHSKVSPNLSMSNVLDTGILLKENKEGVKEPPEYKNDDQTQYQLSKSSYISPPGKWTQHFCLQMIQNSVFSIIFHLNF